MKEMSQTAFDYLGRLPGLNCGKCGSLTCMVLAFMIHVGKATIADCPRMTEK